jgi:hypothetical protein
MPLPTNGRAARQGVWPRRPLRRVTSHKYGTRALALLLTIYQDRYGLRSIRQRINRWAPPVENVTSAYVSHVAALTGRDPDVNLDLHRYTDLRPLDEAVITHELGGQPTAPPSSMRGCAWPG